MSGLQIGDKNIAFEQGFAQWILDNLTKLQDEYQVYLRRKSMVENESVQMPRFTKPVCTGSAALNSHCKNCEKCDWERNRFQFSHLSKKFGNTT